MKLTVLPTTKTDDTLNRPLPERVGFVDDAVVFAILTGSTQPRQARLAEHLAMAATDDMDFAGWCLSEKLPAKSTKPQPVVIANKRPAPPVLEEPGIGEPHRGTHRWWLAGLAGAFSTMLFSVLLLSLSSRLHPPVDAMSIIETPPESKFPVKSETTGRGPQLTSASPLD